MALSMKQGKFTVTAGTGNKVVTGVGFQPIAVMLLSDSATAEGITADLQGSLGWFTGSGAQSRSVFWKSDDNAATTQTFRAYSASGLVRASSNVLTFVSFDAGGFTLNAATDQTVDLYYLALGGSDLTNALVGEFTSPGATGNQDITSVGFQPDVVLLMAATLTVTSDSAASGLQISLGAATSSSARWAFAINAANGVSMTTTVDAMRHQRTDACILGLTNTATIDMQADFVGMLSNGFTVNWTDLPGTASQLISYLALKGGQYKVGACTGAGASTDVVTGFVPTGLFLQSWNAAASNTITASCVINIGGGDGTSEGTISGFEVDAVLNTQADRSNVSTKALRTLIGGDPATVDGECDHDFTSVTDGFRLTWTDTLTALTEICYVAMGSNAAGGGGGATPVVPAAEMFMRRRW